jgi:hypothetical protein
MAEKEKAERANGSKIRGVILSQKSGFGTSNATQASVPYVFALVEFRGKGAPTLWLQENDRNVRK